jgi:hypothetical protein
MGAQVLVLKQSAYAQVHSAILLKRIIYDFDPTAQNWSIKSGSEYKPISHLMLPTVSLNYDKIIIKKNTKC